MRFVCVAILLFFPIFANAFYNATYYEKYNPNVKWLLDTPYAKHISFLIQSGQLRADGTVYTLNNASDINLNQKILKEYDLQAVVIKIGSKYYKATPSFKKLIFVKSGKKGIFRYILTKKLILVYEPYLDKMQVIGVISQGQFIKENCFNEYDLAINKEIKKRILLKIFKFLGCKAFKDCNVKSDKNSNDYFYKDNKLIGILENFGNKKMLMQINNNDKKHTATIIKYNDNILMEDMRGNILYESDNSKKINIKLNALDYEIELKIKLN